MCNRFENFSNNRDDLEPEEYNETKQETLEQMREFQSSLAKLAAGDLSLTDYFAAIQLVRNVVWLNPVFDFIIVFCVLEYTSSTQ